MNMKDIYRDKQEADAMAEARRMLDPSIGRSELSLDNFRPIELPEPVYQDPQAPEVGPPPIKGATQSPLGMGDVLPGAVLGGVTAGLGAAALMGGPAGIAIGIGTGLLGLF